MTWDVVDQASLESFPASDPPGWGSFHAAPSAASCAEVLPLLPKRVRTRRQRSLAAPLIAAAALTGVAMIGLASFALVRRSRARRC